jgi:hypothetical protein
VEQDAGEIVFGGGGDEAGEAVGLLEAELFGFAAGLRTGFA